MQLKQRRQAMLQLYLSNQLVYRLLKVPLILEVWRLIDKLAPIPSMKHHFGVRVPSVTTHGYNAAHFDSLCQDTSEDV